MPFPSQEEMRAEFHSLRKQEAEIAAGIAPLELAYAKLRDQECRFNEEKIKPAAAKLKKAKDDLFVVQNQISQIVRFLRDKGLIANTGEAPSK